MDTKKIGKNTRILFYGSSRHGNGDMFQNMIQRLGEEETLEVYDRIEAFSQRLRKPRGKVSIAVLAALTKSELRDIISLAELLLDLRVVLILPDLKPETVSLAHRIAPRFVTDWSTDSEKTGEVLRRMLAGTNRDRIAPQQRL